MTAPQQPIPIAFCITELDPGGAERAFVRLVLGLNRAEWDPQVYCLSNGGVMTAPLLEAGIPITCLNARNSMDLSVIFKLTRALKQQRPKILQTYLFHANLLGRIAGKLAGVPRIVSGIRVAERRSSWYLRLDRWTEFLVDNHVCVSQAVATHSMQHAGLSPAKIEVIPNGVDFEKFAQAEPLDRASLGVPSDAFVFLTVGRLDPQKGIFDLLQAFEMVRAKSPAVHLLIVGQGAEKEQIEEWIRARQMGNCVQLLGYRDDVPRLMKTADVFVLSSLWEGMPNVLLEAMAAGLPVISTRVEGVEDLILPGETGISVHSGACGELADAMQQAIGKRVASKEMAEKAAQKVRAEFTWPQAISRYEDLYRRLLQR
ncbi:MAG: glycosyltransferase [Planctomycetales bacterium]